MNVEQQRVWDRAWQCAKEVCDHAVPVAELRAVAGAMEYMQQAFAELSRRVDAEELPLVDVPMELRDRTQRCQQMLEHLEGELLVAEASLELFKADLKRVVDEAENEETA